MMYRIENAVLDDANSHWIMADVFDKQKRSQIMASITAKDTQPELLLRKALHARGYRYRLHDKKLPGKPDMVFRKFNAIILVNGCFWHGHDCALFRMPATNREFWQEKIRNNRNRDRNVHRLLVESGWRVLTVWECSLKGRQRSRFDELLLLIERWLLSHDDALEIDGTSLDVKK